MKEFTFTLRQTHPLASNPRTVTLTADRIFCDGATFPASVDGGARYNPRNIRAWVIGNVYGALALVFAAHDQAALDVATDAGLMGRFAIDPRGWRIDDATCEVVSEYGDDVTFLGSADEPHCLDDCWIAQVGWSPERDRDAIAAILRAEAAGNRHPAAA